MNRVKILESRMCSVTKTRHDDAKRLIIDRKLWKKIPLPLMWTVFLYWWHAYSWKFFHGEPFMLVKLNIDGRFAYFRTTPKFFYYFERAKVFESDMFIEEFKPEKRPRKKRNSTVHTEEPLMPVRISDSNGAKTTYLIY